MSKAALAEANRTRSTDDPLPALTQMTHPRLVFNLGSAHLGTLEALSAAGHPLVDFAGNPAMRPIVARSCVDLTPASVGCSVVLMFEGGDLEKPLLMGCVRGAAVSLGAADEPVTGAAGGVSAVDGDVVRVSGAQSLTLRCGRASVTLTSDGKVLVSGTYVETRASGTNRIQGGSVRIN